jgi:hypothetical protein
MMAPWLTNQHQGLKGVSCGADALIQVGLALFFVFIPAAIDAALVLHG